MSQPQNTNTTPSPSLRELDALAKNAATSHIVSLFARPGQLDKLPQLRRRLTHKRGSVEALLKSVMQQQLDAARSVLTGLNWCQQQVDEIQTSTRSLVGSLAGTVDDLNVRLATVRDEHMRHSQYVTARDNLKHIFGVPDSVARTKQWINEGRLLHAHQCLRDVETARDELLYELHKLPNQSAHDTALLRAYFSDVDTLSALMQKQLKLILARTLNTVRKEPTVVVTALRIIEREEQADTEALRQAKATGFQSPGRPKKWRQMALDELQRSVEARVESMQLDGREDHKHWLIRYLELTRQTVLEDLRVVKTLCVSRFPPSYEILPLYIRMYHNSLAHHFRHIIQEGLQGTEYVSMLSWLHRTYMGVEMMGHPELKEYTQHLPGLLSNAEMAKLETDHLSNMESNLVEWLRNALTKECAEWRSSEPPPDVIASTSTPLIIYQMIDQNIQVSRSIGSDLALKVLQMSLRQVVAFGDTYRIAVTEFKTKYFEARQQYPYYTQHMIGILNNCIQLSEIGAQLVRHTTTTTATNVDGAAGSTAAGSSSSTPATRFDVDFEQSAIELERSVRTTFVQLRNQFADHLLAELLLDVDKHFEELFTTRWASAAHGGTTSATTAPPIHQQQQQQQPPMDTICATVDDYFHDYERLSPPNHAHVLERANFLLAKRYLTAMLSKRITFKTLDECRAAARRVLDEVNQLKRLLKGVSNATGGSDFGGGQPMAQGRSDPFDAILLAVDVLRCDGDMMSLELHRLLDTYADVSEEHLSRLLSLRGDLSRSDIRDHVTYACKNRAGNAAGMPPTIFKTLQFPKSVTLNVFN